MTRWREATSHVGWPADRLTLRECAARVMAVRFAAMRVLESEAGVELPRDARSSRDTAGNIPLWRLPAR